MNVSPVPTGSGDCMILSQSFESEEVSRSFIIWYDRFLNLLDCPLHVYYCARSYDGRYNPNRGLIRLTQTVDILLRRLWYGSVIVVKFTSRTCTSYIDISLPDLLHVRDYFAYFA